MFRIYVVYLVIMNILEYFLMAKDKQFAKQRRTRISEKTLLTVAALGGALGGFLAMYIVHHKTKHWYFVVWMPLFVIAYVILTFVLLHNEGIIA